MTILWGFLSFAQEVFIALRSLMWFLYLLTFATSSFKYFCLCDAVRMSYRVQLFEVHSVTDTSCCFMLSSFRSIWGEWAAEGRVLRWKESHWHNLLHRVCSSSMYVSRMIHKRQLFQSAYGVADTSFGLTSLPPHLKYMGTMKHRSDIF